MNDPRTSSSPVTLDKLDRTIINELQDDGRQAYTTIARTLGVSEATVRKRVNRLLRKGAVQIVAAIDPLALGYVRAEVGIRVQGPSLERVSERLEAVPEVSYVELVLGSYDISISLTCRDNDHLLHVLRDTIRVIPGVQQVEAFIVLKVTKDIYRWATDEDG